jgi:hypothetical protein
MQNLDCGRIVLLQSRPKVARFAAGLFGQESSEGAFGAGALPRANACVDRPAGTARLDSAATTVKPDVTELGLAWRRAVVDSAIDDQPPAHTAAQRKASRRNNLSDFVLP